MLEYKFSWIKREDEKDHPPIGQTTCSVYFNEGEFKDVDVPDPNTDTTKKAIVFDRAKRAFLKREYVFDGIVKQEDLITFLNKELYVMSMEMMKKELDEARLIEPIPNQISTKEPTIAAKSVK